MSERRRPRIAVAVTGATGAIFGVRMLQKLAAMDVETHLVISQWGRKTIEHETTYTVDDVRRMADVVHGIGDQGATMSSGSFRMEGMVIAPCSVRTLAAIAHGLADNLVTRAADVMLKERRRLLLMVRESPLNDIHLQNMLTASRAGATICPPVPAFYTRPDTIDDIVDQIVNRALDQLGLEQDDVPRWDGRLGRRPPDRTSEDRPQVTSLAPTKGYDMESGPSKTPEPGHGGDAFADTFDRPQPLPEEGQHTEDVDVPEAGHEGDAFADTFDREPPTPGGHGT